MPIPVTAVPAKKAKVTTKSVKPTEKLKDLFSRDRDTAIARCPSLRTARVLLSNEALTWEQYCNAKASAWTQLKARPPIAGGVRKLSADQVVKAQAKLLKQQEAIARLQARIAQAQAAAKPA